jgi:hypothetical protein
VGIAESFNTIDGKQPFQRQVFPLAEGPVVAEAVWKQFSLL